MGLPEAVPFLVSAIYSMVTEGLSIMEDRTTIVCVLITPGLFLDACQKIFQSSRILSDYFKE